MRDIFYEPDIILDIFGETKYQDIDDDVIHKLKENIKALRALNTWILTDELNEGVNQLIDDAFDEDIYEYTSKLLPVIRMKPVHMRVTDKKKKSFYQNHTIFLPIRINDYHFPDPDKDPELFDNIKSMFFGKSSGSLVSLLIQGGPHRLKDVLDAIKYKIPLLIVSVSNYNILIYF